MMTNGIETAVIGDPFVLASYGLPSRTQKGKGKSVARGEHPFVFASCSVVPRHTDCQVTLAVQGDGIHIIDVRTVLSPEEKTQYLILTRLPLPKLSDLHPVACHTLGPSTSFASAPATLISSEDGGNFRRTYVSVYSSQEIRPEDTGKVVWTWKEDFSKDIGSSQEKHSMTLLHDASYIMVPNDLNAVLLMAKSGSLSVADLDLNIRKSWEPPDNSQKVIRVFLFHRKDAKFVTWKGESDAAVLVVFALRAEGLIVQAFIVEREGTMHVLESCKISCEHQTGLIEVSCDASGFVSLLDPVGVWTCYALGVRGSSVTLSSMQSRLRLKGLHNLKKHKSLAQTSLLSLGSSFVLLAGVTISSEIALLLWDIQYGVLLHSHIFPIPSTLESEAPSIRVSLIKASSTHALLTLSPMTMASSSKIRSTIYVVPFVVPRISTLVNVLGRAGHGFKWLDSEDCAIQKQESSELEKAKEKHLKALHDAINDDCVPEAEGMFFEWVKGNYDNEKRKATSTECTENKEDAKEEATEGGLVPTKQSKMKKPHHALDYNFVTRVLQIFLQPDAPPETSYSPKVFRYLISRRLVSNSMLEGGILSALLLHNDWESIRESFFKVIDLPESEMIRVLRIVVDANRKRSSKNEDAMAVDGQSSQPEIPSTKSFFAYVVEYPSSSSSWRKALHEHFTDVDDLIALLEVIDIWLKIHLAKDEPIILGNVSRNEDGVPVVNQKAKRFVRAKGGLLPSMERILNFLRAILDSSFLTFLQNSSSHTFLRQLSDTIAPHISLAFSLELLRGPLTPFAQTHAKILSDASSGKRKDEIDWRKRRKRVHEQNALGLGLYQIEEIGF